MWKTIINNDRVYLIKLVTNLGCNLYLSDLKELWLEELGIEEVSERFKELNPLCQTSEVAKELTGLFGSINSDHVTIKELESKVVLNMKCVVDDFEIKFNWEMTKQTNDMFFKEITLSLVNTITTLESRQEQLLCIIEKKDKEKEEYIREYGEISRDFLKTIKFNKDKFVEESSNVMLNVLSDEMVVNSLNEKYGTKILKRKRVDGDKANAKKLKKYSPRFLKK